MQDPIPGDALILSWLDATLAKRALLSSQTWTKRMPLPQKPQLMIYGRFRNAILLLTTPYINKQTTAELIL